MKISELNDQLRTTLSARYGRVYITNGIATLGTVAIAEISSLVRKFDDFSEENDPYGEHDFGSVMFERQKIFWKIDYYDKKLKYHSRNPSDPKITTRVLLIMLAEEY